MKHIGGALLIALAVAAAMACGGSDPPEDSPTSSAAPSGSDAASGVNPADFSAVVDNLLFPLSSYSKLVYEGEEVDPKTAETMTTRVEMTVLPETEVVGGVEVLVVQDEAFEDDELIESTLDYYAQHKDGSVYYFGERVNNYENGELKDHDGSWLAGEDNAEPGIIMPPSPAVGDVFEQEKAPGIAEDRMTVLSVTESVDVPAGSFTDCVKTEDVNPLDGTGAIEYKFYCEGVGFTLEEFEGGNLELVSYE
jgi:hypothetical protein